MAYLVSKSTHDQGEKEAFNVGTPHIIPDVLYPAWRGLLDNNTKDTFTDSSASARTITVYADAYHSGANKKIGSTSIDMNQDLGTGDYLKVPDSTDWDFGTGSFTIEAWIYPTYVNGSDAHNIYCHFNSTSDFRSFRLSSGNINWAGITTSGTLVVSGSWQHIAVSRDSGTTKIFINGVQIHSASDSTDYGAIAGDLFLGQRNAGQWFYGFIDELRVVKGTGVYTGAFTPPTALTTTGGTYASGTNVNTSFTAANTKLLIHSDNGGNSGVFGTAQADGKKYYYTDIKGSKPIKDPRIGAHFGSQRHTFKSLQLLEQETAIAGHPVSSIDGREWVRTHGASWHVRDDATGNNLANHDGAHPDANDWIEITGYFNKVNWLALIYSNTATNVNVLIDGVLKSTSFAPDGVVNSPLAGSRYVDGSSLQEVPVGTLDLGIHTLKIGLSTTYWYASGCELITQDTTSTATKSQIQIPSQNVVSYGKKFTVAGTPHYNPFATKGDDSASTIPNNTTGDSVGTGWTGSTSAYWDSSLDTATSLGLGAWEAGSPTVYYRPVNGGRVVKWVDSTGVIKTSVNMMPPESYSIKDDSTGTCAATGTHNWSTQYLPQFGNKTVGSDLAVNGTFASASNWTLSVSSGTWSITSGVARASSAATAGQCYQSFTFTRGKYYKVTFTVSGYSAGAVRVDCLDTISTQYSANGTYSHIFQATSSNMVDYINIRCFGTSTFDIDNVTMFEIEDPSLQAEVAKTFHVREFGNGAANGGTGAAYADASMINASYDDIVYIMDDGLTSLKAAGGVIQNNVLGVNGSASSESFLTFIGTGIGYHAPTASGSYNSLNNDVIAQNLPYGTHIIRNGRNSGSAYNNVDVDGIEVYDDNSAIQGLEWINIFQPKKPPIPEDAVVISDYMLMADFVPQSTEGQKYIPKGVRWVAQSRDYKIDKTAGNFISTPFIPANLVFRGGQYFWWSTANSSGDTFTQQLPFFGDSFSCHFATGGDSDYAAPVFTLNGSALSGFTNTGAGGGFSSVTSAGVVTETGNPVNDSVATFKAGAGTLGSNTIKCSITSNAASKYAYNRSFSVASPIHTSSHYQPFETPLLYELVGGDRNMEQTNLVVTPYGDTWDEVTRDTSYIGNMSLSCNSGTAQATDTTVVPFLQWRGTISLAGIMFNKHFAIGYDRMICLYDGQYHIVMHTQGLNGKEGRLLINGTIVTKFKDTADQTAANLNYTGNLMRGDYVQWFGTWSTYEQYQQFRIHKI